MTDAPSVKPQVVTPAPAIPAPQAKPVDWLRIGLLTMFWGSAFATIEVALESLSPILIVTLRMWIGALFLLCVAAIVRSPIPRIWPRPDPAWKWLVGVGLVGNTVPFFLIPWAQQTTTSGMTGIVVATAPLFVALLGHFFAGETLTGRRSLGLAAAFLGVGVLFAPSILAGAQSASGEVHAQTMAILALLLAAFLYAITAILARFSTHKGMVGGAAGVCTIAALACTPFGLWDFLANGADPTMRSAIAMLALGVGPTALATIVYMATARSAGPGFLSLTNYIVPLFSVALGAALLDEALEPRALAALALILTGLLLAGRKGKARKSSSPA